MDYRSGGLDFHNPPMLLENNANYSHHLQRSIDTLRSLGDRLGDRNVDLRLNLHQERNYDRSNQMTNGLELNLSLNPDRLLQERMQQERSLERLLNERTMQEQRMNLDHSLSIERLNLERSLTQNLDRNLNISQNPDRNNYNDRPPPTLMNDRALMDRNLNSLDRNINNERMGYTNDRLTDRLRLDGSDMRQSDISRDYNRDVNRDLNDLKYREYKAQLENLRSESSRSLERGNDEDRGGTTPSTPPTPISVGENFQDEKVSFFQTFFGSNKLDILNQFVGQLDFNFCLYEY